MTVLVHNNGVHLRSLIDRTDCEHHNAPKGIPCFHLTNNVNKEAFYPGACGRRIKKAGFNGKISPQSMRKAAPKKNEKPAHTQRFGKKPNTLATRVGASK